MSLIELPGLEQRSDEWFAQRRGIVTASAVGNLLTTRTLAAIEYDCPSCGSVANKSCTSKARRAGDVGVPIKTVHPERTTVANDNKHKSPTVVEVAHNDTSHALTLNLAAERITDFTEPSYVSLDMQRGIDDEPRAVEVYSENFAPVTTTGFMVRDDWGFSIGFSPDGLVGDDGLIEVKSRKQKKQLATVLADEVPAENMAQIQCGLLVSGREWCDYISYAGGMHLYPIRVLPDPRWFEAIIQAVELFEKNAAEMVATYEARTKGLPMTERIVELEIF